MWQVLELGSILWFRYIFLIRVFCWIYLRLSYSLATLVAKKNISWSNRYLKCTLPSVSSYFQYQFSSVREELISFFIVSNSWKKWQNIIYFCLNSIQNFFYDRLHWMLLCSHLLILEFRWLLEACTTELQICSFLIERSDAA